ncbi:MAG: ElyC/SanA/YdcF family protein [Patescibacteria group bacterium]
MLQVGLVYGHGQQADGEINAQTKARCTTALKLYKHCKIDRICVTAGVEKNGVSMAKKMAAYFLKNGVPVKHLWVRCWGYNTAGETDACYIILNKEDDERIAGITAISSWYHLPRIWFLWKVRNYGYRVSLAPSRSSSIKDLFIEPLKIVNSILRPFRSTKLRIS